MEGSKLVQQAVRRPFSSSLAQALRLNTAPGGLRFDNLLVFLNRNRRRSHPYWQTLIAADAKYARRRLRVNE